MSSAERGWYPRQAPVAQWIRAAGFEPACREFESLQGFHSGVEQWSARRPHKSEDAGSNPASRYQTGLAQRLELLVYTQGVGSSNLSSRTTGGGSTEERPSDTRKVEGSIPSRRTK